MPLDQPEDKEMSFLEHIDVLRKHIIRSLWAVLAFTILALCFPGYLFDTIIFGPTHIDFWTYQRFCDLSYMLKGNDELCIKSLSFTITNLSVAGQFTSYFVISIIAGIIMAAPLILNQFWLFVKPALAKEEIRYARGLVAFGGVLFAAGILFGYFILTPLSLNFLGSFQLSAIVENKFSLESYLSFISMLTLATGLIFELPVLIYFLAKIGLVTAAFLRKYRRYAIVIILFIAAILTPPDVASQTLMAIPLLLLYELGIMIARGVEKGKIK